ncbi:MAG: TniQ family protein [Chloroflexi bacterium]|nr:TniQ family protein [Chloroflexota bacterium]
MTSYVTRLAAAHHVLVRDLVGEILVPTLYSPDYAAKSKSKTWWRNTTNSLNGLNLSTEDWIGCVQSLTAHTNLTCLTMFTWSRVLPYRSLLKKTCAWCPTCLREWLDQDQTIYYPLIWQLDCVPSCDIHHTTLVTQCPDPNCGKSFTALAPKAYLGFLPTLRVLAGAKSSAAEGMGDQELAEGEMQRWNLEAIGDLLATAATVEKKPEREVISTAVEITPGDPGPGACQPVSKPASRAG